MHEPKPILTIDQGNSKVKTAVVIGTEVTDQRIFDTPGKVLTDSGLPGDVCGIVYSTTGSDMSRELEAVARQRGMNFCKVNGLISLPIGIDYETPQTLGSDRIALIAGAMAFGYTQAVVADAGTALTIDLLDKGSFKGGSIAPGITMRFNALHAHTAHLPRVEAEACDSPLGHNTRSCINRGVVWGAAAEIIWFRKQVAPDAPIILTGGDAEALHDTLLQQGEADVRLIRWLTAVGLGAIGNHYFNRDFNS